MFVKYLQNLSAISMGPVNVLLSDLNAVGREDLFLRLLITSFDNFQIVLGSVLALSNLESFYICLAMRIDG